MSVMLSGNVWQRLYTVAYAEGGTSPQWLSDIHMWSVKIVSQMHQISNLQLKYRTVFCGGAHPLLRLGGRHLLPMPHPLPPISENFSLRPCLYSVEVVSCMTSTVHEVILHIPFSKTSPLLVHFVRTELLASGGVQRIGHLLPCIFLLHNVVAKLFFVCNV